MPDGINPNRKADGRINNDQKPPRKKVKTDKAKDDLKELIKKLESLDIKTDQLAKDLENSSEFIEKLKSIKEIKEDESLSEQVKNLGKELFKLIKSNNLSKLQSVNENNTRVNFQENEKSKSSPLKTEILDNPSVETKQTKSPKASPPVKIDPEKYLKDPMLLMMAQY